jgi:conjugal transfer/entry exclusion protein
LERTKNIIRSQQKENSDLISDSFLDIGSLKNNAQQMIDLSEHIRTKLGSSMKDHSDPALQEISQVLSSIGFIDPVTKETAGKSYYLELAKQINSFFSDYFSNCKNVGIITLIDAYCIYNRARGISKYYFI